jgi:polysaccharide pyruvyl transferase WcaK-like protein
LGQKNLGDEALLDGARRLFPNLSLWHYDGSRLGSLLLNRNPRLRSGILAGGTIINRCAEYLQIAEKFLAGNRRLVVFGSGVAPPDFWGRRADFQDMMTEWKQLLERCDYVGVRGPMSAQLLADAGVKGVEVVGDPVVTFANAVRMDGHIPDSIGLNIGHDHGHQWGDEITLTQEFLKLASLARAKGWMVKWFVVFPRDLEITRQIAIKSGTEAHISSVYTDASQYLKEVQTLSTFVGMKLHATVLASCAHVPSLMVEYTPKCYDFMASIGRQSSNVRSDRFKAADAWEHVQEWNADRDSHSAAIFQALHALQQCQAAKAADLSLRILS